MLLPLAGCGWQAIPQSKNQVDAALAEVTNQYKRRADLIPNLVATVKGYAKHEKSTLTAVIDARAKATSVTIDPSKVSPQKLAQFQQAQGQLSMALGRLMMVSERYPNLKATFRRNLRARRIELRSHGSATLTQSIRLITWSPCRRRVGPTPSCITIKRCHNSPSTRQNMWKRHPKLSFNS